MENTRLQQIIETFQINNEDIVIEVQDFFDSVQKNIIYVNKDHTILYIFQCPFCDYKRQMTHAMDITEVATKHLQQCEHNMILKQLTLVLEKVLEKL